jgi:hypothetical protein
MPRPYLTADHDRLLLAAEEYQTLADGRTAPYTLRSAFDHEGFDIQHYCESFSPNPAAHASEREVKDWLEKHSLWIAGVTDHCIDMASFLYPDATPPRLVAIGKNVAINWYLNDTIGRERFAAMTADGRRAANQARRRIIDVSQAMRLGPAASPVERACLQALEQIRSTSDRRWYATFSRLWVGNLTTMCRDGNARATGAVYSFDQYLRQRTFISGMQHTVALLQYAVDQYLDWTCLRKHDLAAPVRALWWHCAVIGCLSNDLLSLEKEFVWHGSDSNAVLVILLNDSSLTLDRAITSTIERVRGHVSEFIGLVRLLDTRVDALHTESPHAGAALGAFLRSVQWCVMATWIWQTASRRYKFEHSIFAENRSEPPGDTLSRQGGTPSKGWVDE